jgi:PAS domain S-box-containing protein
MALSLTAQILERMSVAVWVVDAEGAIAYANGAASSSLGYDDPRQLHGRPAHETAHHHRPDGSVYPASICPLLRPSATGLPARSDDQCFIRRDGSLFRISWSAAPIELPNGLGTVVSFQDLSNQRRAPADTTATLIMVDASGLTAACSSSHRSNISQLTKYVADNAANPMLNPQLLALSQHMSLRYLQTLLEEAGTTPARLIREQRLLRAKRLLPETQSIAATARASGFVDGGTFTRAFRRHFGMTPSNYLARLEEDR